MNHISKESIIKVNPMLIEEIGLREAVALARIDGVIKAEGYLVEGKRWLDMTFAFIQEEYFSFWSPQTLRLILIRLEELGYIERISVRRNSTRICLTKKGKYTLKS
jgi:hypothetical protein